MRMGLGVGASCARGFGVTLGLATCFLVACGSSGVSHTQPASPASSDAQAAPATAKAQAAAAENDEAYLATETERPVAGSWVGAAAESEQVLTGLREHRVAVWVDVPKATKR